MKAICF